MIISASRRTDIPAFHMDWFMSRMRAGWCATRNPMNPASVSSVDLAGAEAIVFWTKDPRPAMRHLDELDTFGVPYVFQVTATGYGRTLEPSAPGMDESVEAVIRLAERIGPDRVLWRFDPIISVKGRENRILDLFKDMSGKLSGHTRRVTVSFLDLSKYRGAVKATANALSSIGGLRDWLAPDYRDDLLSFAGRLSSMAGESGMDAVACGHDIDLSPAGIGKSACVDAGLLNGLFGLSLASARDSGQRQACGCAPSKDIGVYGTCSHGCLYCYAAGRGAKPKANRSGPFLVGDGEVAPPVATLPLG